jgi:hypothetical protein
VEARLEVDQPRALHAQHPFEHVEVGAPVGHRHRDDARAGHLDRVQRAGKGELLRDHQVARPQQHPRQQRHRLLRAGGDQHLAGAGRQPASGQVRGERLAQGRQPGGLVAGPGERAIPGGRVGQQLAHQRRRLVHRGGQVDGGGRALQQVEEHRVRLVVAARRERPRGHGGATALAAHDQALGAQQLVGGGDGVAADRQRLGEGALRRQQRLGPELALLDQPAQRDRQPVVERPVSRAPAADEAGQLLGAVSHGNQSAPDWLWR